MAYIVAADFRERTLKPWTANLLLTEGDGTDAYIDLVIGEVAAQVEIELNDDFEPPNPDNDETIDIDGTFGWRLYVPRRVRALTTVSTRNTAGVLTAVTSTSYRLVSSLNSAGTAMKDRRKRDWLEGFSSGLWPYEANSVQLVGKFGWSAVPTDIKRLVALRTYDMIKATADPLSIVTQQITVDHSATFGESREMARIISLYNRNMAVVA
jgi:hypothetical protein